jgi:hypothetical protein
MLDKEVGGFLRQVKKPVGSLWTLPDENAGENAIKIALRPAADPGFHLTSSQLPSQFCASLAYSIPNQIGQREMFALDSLVYQGVKFAGVQGFVGPQNNQFPAARNHRRMALKRGVGQSAEGTLCFAETASFHFDQK